ncbi:hypothetical protein [uncultured Gammaproteobacteria bacterium]|nr:hypothetical protein [uncultured Gammaproteobacteria bacterium]
MNILNMLNSPAARCLANQHIPLPYLGLENTNDGKLTVLES